MCVSVCTKCTCVGVRICMYVSTHSVSSKQTKKFRFTETNRNKICFCCVSVCFVKPKTKLFGLFQFVSVFQTYIETTEITELFRNKPKQTKTTLNFLKNTKYAFYLIVSVQSKHRNSLFRYKQNNRNG